jgi:hypothetical protein
MLSLSWRTVAVISAVAAVASLTTLAVVAGLGNADALATVALALAIVSLVSQLIVFIAQTESGARQAEHGDEIYRDTKALLSGLDVSARMTSQMVSGQFDKLLERVLATSNATVEAVVATGGELDVDSLKEQLSADIRRTVNSARSFALGHEGSQNTTQETPTDPHGVLSRWPNTDVVEALASEGVGTLSEPASAALEQLAREYVEALKQPSVSFEFQMASDEPGAAELVTLGLLRPSRGTPRPAAPGVVYRLTAKGRVAIRLFTAELPVPEYVASAFPWIVSRRSEDLD